MKTIDLTSQSAGVEDIFNLAENQSLLVRTAKGKLFVVAEVDMGEADNDFANEVALTRHNRAIRSLLAERSKEPAKYSTDEVRQRLGIAKSPE